MKFYTFRKTDEYQDIVKEYIKYIFPIYSLLEISNILVNDSLLMKKVRMNIGESFRK